MRQLVVLLLIALAMPSAAVEVPAPGDYDARVKWVNYNDWQVYQIVGAIRSAVHIRFAADEEITTVAIGDAIAWEAADVGNNLYLKARHLHPPTNMIVRTIRPDGSERHYQFELRTRDGEIEAGTEGTFFDLRFRYPQDEAEKALQEAIAREAAAAKENLEGRLDTAPLQGPRNWAYMAQGASSLEPVEIWDNGAMTGLRFRPNQEIPAVYIVNPDGEEAIASFDVRDHVVVVHSVASELRLRRGAEVLCLYNEGFGALIRDTGTGTVSPTVTRQPKGSH